MDSSREQSVELMENHRDRREENKDVQKMRSRFQLRQFKPSIFSGVVLGAVIGITINEVCIQLILKISRDAGELPHGTNDAFLIIISLLECLLAPFVSWYGHDRRRSVLLRWMTMAILTTLLLFPLGFDIAEHSDLCDTTSTSPATTTFGTKSVVRLVVLAVMAVVSALTRISYISHGVAVIEEHDHDTVVKEFGILITARVIALLMTKSVAEDLLLKKYWLQILVMVAPLMLKLALLAILPPVPVEPEEGSGRDFLPTIKRVVRNPAVVVHSVSAGLLCAGVWGYSLYNNDVIAAKYRFVFPFSSATMNADMLRWQYAVAAMVIITSYKYTPSLKEIGKQIPIKQMSVMAAISVVFMIVTGVLRCDRALKGLSNEYLQPLCSGTCGCTERQLHEFNPVCVLAEMTTYYSPCHAGCTNTTEINGFKVLQNCRCGGGGGGGVMTAVEGACGAQDCFSVYTLHQTLFTGVIIVTVTSILLHSLMVMMSVQPSDRSTALGVTGSVITLLCFVGGHALFMAISSWTCVYKKNGQCHLHSASLGLVISLVGSLMVAVSALINIVNYIAMKRKA